MNTFRSFFVFFAVVFLGAQVHSAHDNKKEITRWALDEGQKIDKRFWAGKLTFKERNELKMLVVTLYEDYEENKWKPNQETKGHLKEYRDRLKEHTLNNQVWNSKDPKEVQRMKDLIQKHSKKGNLSRDERKALRQKLRDIVRSRKKGDLTQAEYKEALKNLREEILQEAKDDERKKVGKAGFMEVARDMKERLSNCKKDGKIDGETFHYLSMRVEKAKESKKNEKHKIAKTQMKGVREHFKLFCQRKAVEK